MAKVTSPLPACLPPCQFLRLLTTSTVHAAAPITKQRHTTCCQCLLAVATCNRLSVLQLQVMGVHARLPVLLASSKLCSL